MPLGYGPRCLRTFLRNIDLQENMGIEQKGHNNLEAEEPDA